jgi:hypothetical protein
MEDLPATVRVAIRVRPLQRFELERGDGVAATVSDGTCYVAVPGEASTAREFSHASFVGGPTVSQRAFFDSCGVAALVDAAVEGCNVSVFAYGQTGSGKTFTMSGDASSAEGHGVIPRAVARLFHRLREAPHPVVVRVAVCEVYNEQIFDLLQSGNHPPLALRQEHGGRGSFVVGQVAVEVDGLEEVLAALEVAAANRSIASHAMNIQSSRSHAVTTLFLEHEEGGGARTLSKMLLVDLAGSERLKDSQSEGQTGAESRSINTSLLALGKTIAALGDKQSRAGGAAPPHVPYRDSKLTQILQDSLGGTARTLMIACTSPSTAYADETVQTLNYSLRASRIENAPVVKLEGVGSIASRKRDKAVQAEIAALTRENALLRGRLGLPSAGELTDEAMDTALDALVAARTPAVVTCACGSGAGAGAASASGGPRLPAAPALRARLQQTPIRTAASVTGRMRSRSRGPNRRSSGITGAASLNGSMSDGGESLLSEDGVGQGSDLGGPPNFTSRIAERLLERSARQLVIDQQQNEMACLTQEVADLRTKAATQKSRIAALLTDREEARSSITRLTGELQTARQSQHDAEDVAHEALLRESRAIAKLKH